MLNSRFKRKIILLPAVLSLVTNTTWGAVSIQSALPAIPTFAAADPFNIDINDTQVVVATTDPSGYRINLASTSSLTTYQSLPSPADFGIPNTASAPGITIDQDNFISVAYTNANTNFTSFTIEPNAPVASENSSGLNPTIGEQNLALLMSDEQGNLIMAFSDSQGGNAQAAVEPANVDNQWETTSTEGANILPNSLQTAFSQNNEFGTAVWVDKSGNTYQVYATTPETTPALIADIASLKAQIVYTTSNPNVVARNTVDANGNGTLFIADSTASANIMYLRGDRTSWNLTLNQIPALSSANVTALELITANTGVHFGALINSGGQATAFCGIPNDAQWVATPLSFPADPASLALDVGFTNNNANLLIREKITETSGNLLILTWSNVALGLTWFTNAMPYKFTLKSNSILGTAIKSAPKIATGQTGVVGPTTTDSNNVIAVAALVENLDDFKALSSYFLQVTVIDSVPGVLNLYGRQFKALCSKKMNLITWRFNSKGPAVSGYEIYSDADLTTLVGTVHAKRNCSRKIYVFIDKGNRSQIYYLVTRYVDGSVSPAQPVSVNLSHNRN